MSLKENSTFRFRDEVKSTWATVKTVWTLVPVADRLSLASASGIIALISAANVLVALLLGKLVDQIHRQTLARPSLDFFQTAGTILTILASIYVAREGLNVARRIIVERSCTRLNCELQRDVVAHVLRFDLQSLASQKIGALHGRIFRSIDGLIHFVRLMFLDVMPAFLTGFLAISMASFKEPLLGAVMLGVIPVSLWLTMRQLRSQKGVRIDLMRDGEAIAGTVIEQLDGVEYIRVANTVAIESARLATVLEKRRKREIRHHAHMALYGSAKALNEGAFHILVLALASYLAFSGQISAGDVLAFSVLFMNVMTPLNEIHRVIDEGHESSLRVQDLRQLLNTEADPSFFTFKHTSPLPKNESPLIELANVRYAYGGRYHEAKSVLRGISLQISKGETIGVAGASGSGKSTWARLLLRLLHVHEGQIVLWGQDLTQIDRQYIAHNMGYVGQTPFVFSGTIRENIVYGCTHATEEEIHRAAQKANLHHEILDMPGGYDAMITERGKNLSGGQRQRLAIARVLLHNPQLLILDEATSALDNISERLIQSALSRDRDKRTTVIIAHRLSTLRDCDRILVFEKGRIVESGSYSELIARQGIFAQLAESGDSSPFDHSFATPLEIASAV